MDQPVTFTVSDIITAISAIAGFLVAINAAILVMIQWWKKIHQPETVQNERLQNLEDRVATLEKAQQHNRVDFKEAFDAMKDIEDANKKFQRIMVESLQALSEHAIDGNHTESLKKSAKELNNYIMNRMWGEYNHEFDRKDN